MNDRGQFHTGQLEVVRIFCEILLSTTKTCQTDKLQSAGRLLKAVCKLIGILAIKRWLQLLQLIADCKLVTDTYLRAVILIVVPAG